MRRIYEKKAIPFPWTPIKYASGAGSGENSDEDSFGLFDFWCVSLLRNKWLMLSN